MENIKIQKILWIDQDVESVENTNYLNKIKSLGLSDVELQCYNSVDAAMNYLKKLHFDHVRLICSGRLMENLLQEMTKNKLQEQNNLTYTLFVFSMNSQHYKDIYAKLPEDQRIFCTNNCRVGKITCMMFSDNYEDMLNYIKAGNYITFNLRQMSQYKQQLIQVGESSGLFEYSNDVQILPAIDLTGKSNKKLSNSNVDFIGYQNNIYTQVPKLAYLIRLPSKKYQLDNLSKLLTCVFKVGEDFDLTENELLQILRYFWISSTCWKNEQVDKYLLRLWTEESKFYKIFNEVLISANEKAMSYFRHLVYRYFQIFQSKKYPYYIGTVYRGIQVTNEQLQQLLQFVGETIYFTTFLSTSKSRDRAFKGNVLFEIETISKDTMDKLIFNQNVDISSFSMYPQEQEVLFLPLDVFTVKSHRIEGNLNIFNLVENSGLPFQLTAYYLGK
ncbi:NAD:arginine ADP-ribosyltransferase (macronuclear) [Tetrahymena thermophila SB210]|uniref:NAD(P)(+)--arginine ADP-ribosyltransferase n=1 Tax=Tetrahymena thermophila (strain SB210) TaxID=312017 RepID=Q237J0_TETTS|nr:NAD:arginine ADP-ribosyltransferase [Tetrahymena thermophila SB210]EAR92751.1 NAD:arginine ADP-ribosyltransferase [Tetrahymena thermophila SB210]|eukprot:XP_001012996.1 NAD:arginine ADP-ribosyltransferase [Tetrahymena thermophila SB210]